MPAESTDPFRVPGAALFAGAMLIASGALFLCRLREGDSVDGSALLFCAWAAASGVGVIRGSIRGWFAGVAFAGAYAMIGVLGGALTLLFWVTQLTGVQDFHGLNVEQIRNVTIVLWVVGAYSIGLLATLWRSEVRAHCVRTSSKTATASA